jgi:hypothetical protein
MRLFLCLAVCLVHSGICAQAFEARTVSGARLSEAESKRFERLKKAPGVVRARLIAINEESLLDGALAELSLFDNVRVGFRVSKSEREQVWKGRAGRNFDRFVIRKVGGRYSGHILRDGKQYVLTPITKGVSALYEVDGQFECGLQAKKQPSRNED